MNFIALDSTPLTWRRRQTVYKSDAARNLSTTWEKHTTDLATDSTVKLHSQIYLAEHNVSRITLLNIVNQDVLGYCVF